MFHVKHLSPAGHEAIRKEPEGLLALALLSA